MAIKIETLQKLIRSLLWAMFLTAIITIGIAWIFYPEPYNFFQEAVSALGGIYSTDGLPNPNSKLIMTIGFFTTGAISFATGIIYFVNPRLDNHMVKGIFLLLMGVGASGIGMPYNKSEFYIWHFIGAFVFLLFFGIFNLVTQIYRFYRKHDRKQPVKNVDYYHDLVMVFVLLIAVFSYFVVQTLETVDILHSTWLTGPLIQKIVLFSIGIATFLLDVDDI